MSRGSIFWGIILILLGSIFILNNLGFLSINVWQVFGPLLLVILGIWVILRAFIGKAEKKNIQVPLNQVKEARMHIDFAAGKLVIRGNSNPNHLIDGELSDQYELSDIRDNEKAKLKISLKPQFFPIAWIPGGIEWNLNLNNSTLLSLDISSGACDSTIDLTGLKVKEFVLNTGASSTNLTLPDGSGTSRYTVKAGLASVNIRIPAGIEGRIRASAGLGAVSVDRSRFLVEKGGYKSNGYDSALNKIDLVVETGLGSIDIR